MAKKIFLAALLAGAFFQLSAEVYWLGPGRRVSKGSDRIAGLLPGLEKVLYSQKITVNNCPVPLEVSAVKGNIEDIALSLKALKVDKLNISGGTLRFERPAGESVERFLLVASRKNRPVTCFKMTVPKELPPPGDWPSELPPLPPGAEITAVTRLENGAVCGEFKNAAEPPYVLLRRVDALLRNRKMFPAGNEIASRDGGKGEIFFDKSSIVLVNFSHTGHGMFFYRKRSK